MTEDYTLAHGTHADPREGRCAMEWVSHLAGEPHSDAPACVSPVLRALCVTLNDGLPDRPRQRLRPYLARTIGTAGDGLDPLRGRLALDWLTRVYAPTWLDLADLPQAAAALRSCPPLTDELGISELAPALQAAQAAARGQRRRSFGAGPAGRVAARRGARAGREAAWTCAGAGAWAAARVGLTDPRADLARGLVRALAGDAAAIAVHRLTPDDVCGPAGARASRRTALGPTLSALADEAIGLLHAMLPGEPIHLPAPAAPRLPAVSA